MNNRAKYETLALAVLKDLAKARGIKGLTGLKKADVIEAMVKKDEEEAAAAAAAAAPAPAPAAHSSKIQEFPGARTGDEASDNSEASEKGGTSDGIDISEEKKSLDSGIEASGILEVLSDGYGFIRSENYLPGENDVYVAPSQIRRFSLKTGDIITGNTRVKSQTDKFGALLFVKTINGLTPQEHSLRKNFEDLTPIFPDEKLTLEGSNGKCRFAVLDNMADSKYLKISVKQNFLLGTDIASQENRVSVKEYREWVYTMLFASVYGAQVRSLSKEVLFVAELAESNDGNGSGEGSGAGEGSGEGSGAGEGSGEGSGSGEGNGEGNGNG